MGNTADLYNQQSLENYTGGLLGQALGNYAGQAQQAMQNQYAYSYRTNSYQTNIELGTDRPIRKMAKKTGRLLIDLRREIDDWHGDILSKAS